MGPQGTWISKELPGPESYEQWLSSWRVFAVACLMLKIASLAALTTYERFMEKLTRMWPTAWHLVYSADDKCRAEHLERLRRAVVLDEVCGKPRPEGYDPDSP
eukprot:5056719-Amphidinium_carterae.1